MKKALDSRSYQIVPFEFEGSLDEIIDIYNKDKEMQKNWVRPKKTSAEYLLSYVNKLITNENENGCIGIVFELDMRKHNCEKLGIPRSKSKKALYYNGDKYSFGYNFINIYLFETNVGFLVYSLDFGDDPTNIVTCNNIFKKYNHSIAYESYEDIIESLENKVVFEKSKRKVSEEAIAYKQEQLNSIKEYEEFLKHTKRSKLVKELIQTLGVSIKSFFTNSNEPDYSHMLTYLRLEKESSKDDIEKYLFKLKGGVTESCKPTLKDLDLENGDGNIHLYDNYWWGVSIEGVTCICKDTEDEKTNGFNTSFGGTIQDVYLYIYIIMLHMRYGLLKYIIEASDISKKVIEVTDNNEEVEKLNLLQKKIIQFDFRGIFNEISNMSAHIQISDMIRDKLRIESLNNELQAQIDNLSKLIDIYTEKIENKHNNRIETIFQSLAIILAGLALSTYVRDSVDSILGVYNTEISKIYLLVPIVPLLSVNLALLIVNMYKNNGRYKTINYMLLIILIILLIIITQLFR